MTVVSKFAGVIYCNNNDDDIVNLDGRTLPINNYAVATGYLGDDTINGANSEDRLFGDSDISTDLHFKFSQAGVGYSHVFVEELQQVADGPPGFFGNDVIDGGGGNDNLFGGGGNNDLTGGTGADIFYTWFNTGFYEGLGAGLTTSYTTVVRDFTLEEADRIDVGSLRVGDFLTVRSLLEIDDEGNVVLKLYQNGFESLLILAGISDLETLGSADFIVGQFEVSTLFQNSRTGVYDGRSLQGTSFRDDMVGGNGAQTVFGGDDTDRLFGEAGDDSLSGDAGDDTIFAGSGRDTAVGGSGADQIDGGNDADLIKGGSNVDRVVGGDGNDRLFGDGDDGLSGEDAVTSFSAGEGDTLEGGAGNDLLAGNGGDDTLTGGSGSDTFRLSYDFNNRALSNDTKDIVTDFSPTQVDRVDFSEADVSDLATALELVSVEAEGARVSISWGGSARHLFLKD